MRIKNLFDAEHAINQILKTISDLKYSLSNIKQLGNQVVIGGDTTFQGKTETRLPNILALSSGTEPTDADATGAFVAEPGYEFDGKTYNVGNVKDGVLGAGFSDDGGITANEGEIGGFVIGADTLESANYVADTAGVKLTGSTGLVEANNAKIGGFAIDNNTIQSDNYVADTAGVKLTASTGMVEANNAKIGGWEVDNTKIESQNYTAGQSGATLNGLTGDIEVNNIKARGTIVASVFEKGQVTATSGTFGVFKSAGKLKASVTTAATFNIDIDDPESGHAALFAADDILRIKDGSGDNWATVDSVSDQTTFYRYACTLESGSAATFTPGTIVLDYGQANDGFLWMTADDTNAPFYAVYTHAGEPWTAITEVCRFGNLNGALDYVSDKYGIVIGDDNGYMKYDPEGGLQIGFGDGELIIDSNAMTVNKMGYAIQHTATDGTTERTGSLGMWATPGSTEPCYGIAYNAPADETDILDGTNAGFETGDFTGWTKTTETVGSWVIYSKPVCIWNIFEGTYMGCFERATTTSSEINGVLTKARDAVTAGTSYKITFGLTCSGWPTAYAKIEIKWYDHASAGTLIQTDQLAYQNTNAYPNLSSKSVLITAPDGALSCEIVVTGRSPARTSNGLFVAVDGFTMNAVSISSQLYFDSTGALNLTDCQCLQTAILASGHSFVDI
jgi:hypothetical protein